MRPIVSFGIGDVAGVDWAVCFINRSSAMCLGIPGRIVELRDNDGFPMGLVDFGGVRREVCLSYVEHDAGVGDYVVVHVGFAISKVDEAEAHRTFEALREMSLLDELEWLGDVADASLGTAASGRDAAP